MVLGQQQTDLHLGDKESFDRERGLLTGSYHTQPVFGGLLLSTSLSGMTC